MTDQPEKKQKTEQGEKTEQSEKPEESKPCEVRPKGVIPTLMIGDGKASEAIAWYTKVLDAKEVDRTPSKEGKLLHAEISINGGVVYLSDDFPEHCDGVTVKHGTSVGVHINLDDADVVFEKALKEGATVEMALEDQFWGDRYGKFKDPFGFVWSLLSKAKNPPTEEAQKVRKQMMGE